jgi:diacylglycerol kinase family enzyme
VLIDGRLHWFLAHLVARRSWLRGRVVVAANAAFIGDWNIAPRAHPGDGRLDLLDGDPPLGDRWKARRRLASGTHLPHPDIAVRRVTAAQIDLDRPTPIALDGSRVGTARSLSIRVEPDAVDLWI